MEEVHSVLPVQWSSQEGLFRDLMGDISGGKWEDQRTNLQSNTALEQIHSKKIPPPYSLPQILPPAQPAEFPSLSRLETSLYHAQQESANLSLVLQKPSLFLPRGLLWVQEHTCFQI